MLKISRSYFLFHAQAAIHSLNLLCRKPLATLMTVIVIAISLTLPTLFWMFTYNLNKLTGDWQRGGHITVYLQSPVTEFEQTELLTKIRNTRGVSHASLKTPAEGLAELTQQEGMHDIMRYLPENPLPPVIDVVPALIVDSPAKLDLLTRQLQALPDVEQTKLDMEWVSRVHAISVFVGKLTSTLMIILGLAVVLIIATTLRLTIQSRQEEVQILKLIGATDSYIMRPFLYSGIWYGLAGAIIAVFLVNIVLLSIGLALNQLAVVYQMHYPIAGLSFKQILSLLFFALSLGWLAAHLSSKRQLSSIEPYN